MTVTSDYCERLSTLPWAEPLNALSNLAFLYAALLAWRMARRCHGAQARADARLLAVLLALVGCASLSFHTFASPTTGILDVAFIGVFNLVYLCLFVRRVLGLSKAATAAAGAGFLALDQLRGALLPARLLFGSTLYLPPLLVLGLLILASRGRAPAASRRMAGAAAVFLVSLTARTLDRPLCSLWPWGLHFLWHLLNAWVLLQLIRALLEARGEPASVGIEEA